MDIRNNKFLKTIVMVGIIISSALTLGLKFYMDNEALSVDRPSFIKTTPNNQAAILFGNSIFFINRLDKTATIFNFDDNNLQLQGDFDFFSNGDLLVYSNSEEPTLLQSLKTFTREQETRNEKTTGDNGFYRCHIQTKTCRKFVTNLPAFHSTFRLVIDRQTDTLYLADTPKFILYKVNSDGILLSQNTDKLHFPNQLYYQNNILYIANTNKHSIKKVETNTAQFGKEIESYKSVIDSNHRWPSEVIKTPNGWWVGIADSSMSKGWIQVFDNNWNKRMQVIPTDPNADIWSIAIFENTVLMSDWSNINIYRFNLSGEQLSDFSNHDINLAFEQARQDRDQYNLYSFIALIGFFIVFSLGLLAAFILEKKESLALFSGHFSKDDKDIESNPSILETPPGKDIYWIETKHRKYRKLIITMSLLSTLYILYLIISITLGNTKFEWGFIISLTFLIPILLLATWVMYRNLSVEIGISGQLLLIDEGNGTVGIGKEAAIQYTKGAIFIGNAIAIIGQPDNSFFPKDEIKKWVQPRVIKGQKINEWSFFKKLWSLKHPMLYMIILILFFIPLSLLLN